MSLRMTLQLKNSSFQITNLWSKAATNDYFHYQLMRAEYCFLIHGLTIWSKVREFWKCQFPKALGDVFKLHNPDLLIFYH